MAIESNVSLQPYNTFGINANAKHFASIDSLETLRNLLKSNTDHPIFILGGGSNMLLTKDIEAMVLHINLKGIRVVEETNSDVVIEVKAGENWHQFVLWCIDNDYGGIENLSLIPGNTGSAPIQNIGAYGVELKDVFVSCNAINIYSLKEKTFTKKECKFGYRESVFKRELKGQYIITDVRLRLTKQNHKLQTSYGAIATELKAFNIFKPSIKDISNAVIRIRQSKLPDPKQIGNSGSFFKNPVVSKSKLLELQKHFPNMPHYVVSQYEVKIPAGWLIETAGFKGKRFNNYGVHNKQALVLVNYGGASGKAIFELALLIQNTIKQLFNINIEMEVNVI